MTVLSDFAYQILVYRKARDPLAKAMQLALAETNKIEKSNKPRMATDADLFKVLKNTIAGLKETLNHSVGDMVYVTDQIHLFEKYLPKIMSDEALAIVISAIMANNEIDGMKSMGLIMSELKRLHPGQYDGQLASAVVRNLLTKAV